MLSYRSNNIQPRSERDRRIIDLYKDNSLREVGVIMEIHLETVRRVLKRYGVRRRPAHKNIHPHSGHHFGYGSQKRNARHSQHSQGTPRSGGV